MFVVPKNTTGISALDRGVFALPAFVNKQLSPFDDTPRLRRSIKGMQTILRRFGFEAVASIIEQTHDGGLPKRMEDLEQLILKKMRSHVESPADRQLEEIFHLVQFWGGIAGRSIYVQNHGFGQNFDPEAYQNLALLATDGIASSELGAKLSRIMVQANRIKQFGVSFATKHARFWAKAAEALPLPIYDRVMAQGCLGYSGPQWKQYPEYVEAMAAHAQEAQTDVHVLERNAFAFFGSDAGRSWIQIRTSQQDIIQKHLGGCSAAICNSRAR
jgi:hypothetical protein